MDEYGQPGQTRSATHADGTYADRTAHTELLASLRVDRPRSVPGAWTALLADTIESPTVTEPSQQPGEVAGPAAPADFAAEPLPRRAAFATPPVRPPVTDDGARVPATAAPDAAAPDASVPADESAKPDAAGAGVIPDADAVRSDALRSDALQSDAVPSEVELADGELPDAALLDVARLDAAVTAVAAGTAVATASLSASGRLGSGLLAADPYGVTGEPSAVGSGHAAGAAGTATGGPGAAGAAGAGAASAGAAGAAGAYAGAGGAGASAVAASAGDVNPAAGREPPSAEEPLPDDLVRRIVARGDGLGEDDAGPASAHSGGPGSSGGPYGGGSGYGGGPAYGGGPGYGGGTGRPDTPVGGSTPPPPGLVPLLPHRVPAPPDVPDVPDDIDDADEPEASLGTAINGGELSRIATRLRDDEQPAEPPADLDVSAVLEAVRKVPGVANAQLRGVPGGMHTLRLDLADGADAGRVSRLVARLLKERMGLAAEPRRPRPDEPTRESTLSARPAQRPATLADVPAPRPPAGRRTTEPGSRVIVDQVRVSTLGSEATVEVRLVADGRPSVGAATGPAVDGYLLRLAASAAASAIDGLIEASPRRQVMRCFIDHAGVVPFGSVNVAVVVVLVSGAGWVEQLVGSALVGGDPRQAIVRATLAAVNRRLEALLG